MLSKIPAYRNLPDEKAFQVIDSIVILCQKAKEKGYLLDSEIKEALGDLDVDAVEIPSNAMNTQRALWLNKDGVLELRKIQIAQREEKRKQAEATEEKK